MVRQLDDHWVHHLTSLDMLREGINLRAIGQQNPLVAYQREAFAMYQEMLASVQTEVVQSLFRVPRAAATSSRRPAAQPQAKPRPQHQLTFRAGGGSGASDRAPEPHRAQRDVGRNDPCWCGSGKKYKDCHWRSDRKAMARSSGSR
jgi:preprotein translocase subunit SecA